MSVEMKSGRTADRPRAPRPRIWELRKWLHWVGRSALAPELFR